MYEQSWQHHPPERQPSRIRVIVGGTLVALLLTVVGFQFWRARPGFGFSSETNSGAAGAAGTSAKDRYVASVDGQLVTWQELAQECVDRFGEDVLDNLINRLVIQRACAEKGIEVSVEEVRQEIMRISKRFGLDVQTWYTMLEAERDLTQAQYRRDIIWPMLALKKLAGADVRITKTQLREAYQDRFGEKVKARMIMLDNLRRAQAVWERVHRNPDDFERIAREESVESNSRALGGVIPPIRQFSSHEELRKAAFDLRTPGEVSGIVQLGLNSYVILKYEGRTERVDHDPKDVRAELYHELMEHEVQKLVATTFKRLREEALIDNYVSGKTTRQSRLVSRTKAASEREEPPFITESRTTAAKSDAATGRRR